MTDVVYSESAQFKLNGNRLRVIGGNTYGLMFDPPSNYTDQELDDFFGGCRRDGVRVIRSWFYSNPAAGWTQNVAGAFRYRDNTIGSSVRTIDLNILDRSFEKVTSVWSMDADYTRSALAASNGSYGIRQVSTSGNANFYYGADGITVVPNMPTTLYFDKRVFLNSGLPPQIQINSGSAFGTTIAESTIAAGGTYEELSITFTPTTNKVWPRIYNNGGNLTADYDNFRMSYTMNATTDLQWREEQWAHADRVLYYANKYGVKLILVLENNWESVSKHRGWHDGLYGTHFNSNRDQSVSLSRVGTTVTGTTTTPHELYPGCLVWMKGAVQSGFNGGGIRVQTTPTTTTFTYTSGVSGTTTATGTTTVGRGVSNSYDVNSPTHQTTFHVSSMKQFTKDVIDKATARTNTYDGILWKNHPAIFSWELMNEARYGQNNDPNINTSNSFNVTSITAWANEMSSYIKYKDPNHMIGFGDTARSLGYISWGGKEDQMLLGSYYGVDYTQIGALLNIDYLDPHMYVYQFNNLSLRSNPGYLGVWYGQGNGGSTAFGGTARGVRVAFGGNSPTVKGLIVTAHVTSGKPLLFGEWGVVKDATYTGTEYPSYPRWESIQKTLWELMEDGCDGFLIWHYYGTLGPAADKSTGVHSQNRGAYPPVSPTQGVNYSNLPAKNSTDLELLSLFAQWDRKLNGGRVLVEDAVVPLRPAKNTPN
jgi:hypothetical protein